MMTNVRVFHCSEVECRWGRGVEYTNESADAALEAAASMCALDGRQARCPLASPQGRARLLGDP